MNTQTMTTMTIRDRAAAALAEAQAAWAEVQAQQKANEERENAERLVRLMKRRLGLTVSPERGRITLDGLTFEAAYFSRFGHYEELLAIVAPCPCCGEEVSSSDIRTWADLGAQLERFTPDSEYHRSGECMRDATIPEIEAEMAEMAEMAPYSTPTPVQALLDALTAYIDWACTRHANDE